LVGYVFSVFEFTGESLGLVKEVPAASAELIPLPETNILVAIDEVQTSTAVLEIKLVLSLVEVA
jgi:phenylpyruvate tautomerase PptA (4-oxalocrotonate tautomerase family)